jgi:hypothetical protein
VPLLPGGWRRLLGLLELWENPIMLQGYSLWYGPILEIDPGLNRRSRMYEHND